MRFNKFGCMAAWSLIGLLVAPALGDDQIDLASVPAVVTQAAAKVVPGARWTEAEKDTERGQVVYELKGTNAKGQAVEAWIRPDGTVFEVETQLTLAEAPAAVSAALKARHPMFRPLKVKSELRPGTPLVYEFEGKLMNGQDMEIELTADGQVVRVKND
jgi:hypothetical protein